MANVLEQLHINFETEFSPSWVKPYKYDFFIPELKLIIEMDGGLGHGKKSFNDTKVDKLGLKRDKIKDVLANEHNIKIFRINSDVSEKNFLKENIKLELESIFSFENVNWDECDRYTTSSLVKIVCDDYHTKKEKPIDIAKTYHICKETVITYLKKGAEFGWCDYNPSEERSIYLFDGKNVKSKPVLFIEHNIVYKSIGECSR